MDYTENYQLSLWDMTDAVKMDDFNSDHEKIDAALASKAGAADLSTLSAALNALSTTVSGCGNCHMETGTYTGAGTYGSGKSTGIKLSRKPMLLFIAGNGYVAVAAAGSDTAYSASDSSIRAMYVTWGSDGSVSWWSDVSKAHQMNGQGVTYTYYALYI